MKTGKIGAIFLISILALAGIGMGVASWTDTITIDGTVETGNVDLVVDSYSGTWIWKCVSTHKLIPTETDVPPCDNAILVSSAWAEQGVDEFGVLTDDAVRMTFKNLFPCVWLYADVVLHYQGSIPVRINGLSLTSDLPDGIEITTEMFLIVPDGDDIPIDIGMQLHYCDKIKVIIGVHVFSQADDTMNLDGTITGNIDVVQWNHFS